MSRRPFDSDFLQQRLQDWQLKVDINFLIVVWFLVGIVLIPIGVYLQRENFAKVVEHVIKYDGEGMNVLDCHISTSNEAKTCMVGRFNAHYAHYAHYAH